MDLSLRFPRACAGLVLLTLAVGCGDAGFEPAFPELQLQASAVGVKCAEANAPTPDFDGDCNADLWWHSHGPYGSGQVYFWKLVNGQRFGATQIKVGDTLTPATLPASWYAVATVDVNKDGYVDIVWHNRSTGQVSYWLLENEKLRQEVSVSVTGKARPWYLAGAYDFDGDGTIDLLWQPRGVYPTSTNLLISYMNSGGTTVKREDFIYSSPGGNPDYLTMPEAVLGVYDVDMRISAIVITQIGRS